MITVWIGIGIGLVVLLLIAMNWKRQYVFILTITDSTLTLTHGQINEDFFEDVQRICKLFSVHDGQIKAVQGRKGVNLICTGSIKSQQRALQNALNHPI